MRTNHGLRHSIHPGLTASVRSSVAPVALILICLAGWPSPASAQATDVTVVAGGLAVRPDIDDTDRYRDAWYDSGQIGLIVGRHLSTNLKLELDLSTSTEGRQYLQRLVNVPGVLYPVPYASERFTTLRQVSGSLVWQFFDNEWAHPFVQAGVAADFERVRSHTPAQSYFVGDPRLPGSRVDLAAARRDGPHTTATAGLVLGGGAKLYATPRVFIRTEGRFTATRTGHHVALRVGVGFDF